MPFVAKAAESPSLEAIASRVKDYRAAVISDIHLFHPQTHTSLIIENLDKAFPDNAETAALDVIHIDGDLFDTDVPYADGLVPLIESWALRFLRRCSKHDIMLRVLAGTYSHDRNQSRMFDKLKTLHNLDVDLLYVDKVWVEHSEKLATTILYVPDFTTIDEQTVWGMVETAMNEAGVSRVGYAHIHGGWSYQMPDMPAVQRLCHRMDKYLAIVDNYISSGHIHTPSIYARIYCNGSFDRLNQGEEEPKGHWRFWVPKDGKDEITFIVNEGAQTYTRVDVMGLPLEEAISRIESVAKVLRVDSRIEIQSVRGDPIFGAIPRMRTMYPNLVWSIKALARAENAKSNPMEQLVITTHTRLPLDKDGLPGIMLGRLKEKNLSEELLARCATLLPEYL